MPQYQWLQFSTAKSTLAGRLADPNFQFWTNAECGAYLAEALRVWNAFTEIWNTPFNFNPTSSQIWYNLSTLTGSPRLRTVTDANLYAMMLYHLLEPQLNAGVWAGTSQFSLADLTGALQRRRDEVIQFSGCNLVDINPFASTPNVSRNNLADTVLEPQRARFIATNRSDSPPVTLSREDAAVFDAFDPDHLQSPAIPSSWSVVAGPPLSLDTNVAPSVPGAFDLTVLQSGLAFNPPALTLLGVPDDWSWVPKWGALSDLLSRESEATDRARAQFCLQRYQDAIKVMRDSNWLVDAQINGVPCDTPGVREMDAYSPDWEENETSQYVITAGIDLIAPCPVGVASVLVNLVGNAPIPVQETDYVQISRDNFDAILAYAQALAMLKMGGSEFQDSMQLYGEFALAASATNQRLLKLGIFTDVLRSEGKRQQEVQPR